MRIWACLVLAVTLLNGAAAAKSVAVSDADASSAATAKTVYQPGSHTSLTAAKLPSSLATFKARGNFTYHKLSPKDTLFSAEPDGCNGYVHFLGIPASPGVPFMCNATLAIALDGVQCSSLNGATQLLIDIGIPANGKVTASVTASSTAIEDATVTVLKESLLPWMLLNLKAYDTGVAAVHSGNADRHSSGRAYTAGVYFLIGLAMLEMTAIGIIWMNWLWQPLQTIKTSALQTDEAAMQKSRNQNLLMWLFLFVFCINFVSIFGGFLAWVVAGTLLFLFICIMNGIVYPLVRRKYQKICLCCGPDESTLAGASGMKTESGSELEAVDKKGDKADGSPVDPRAGKIPGAVHPFDYKALLGLWSLFFLTGFICIIVFFPGWTVDEYFIWDRSANKKLLEFQPSTVAKMLQMMYAWDRVATNLRFNTFADISTTYCGKENNKYVEPGDRKEVIYDQWISKYNINMKEYTPEDYREYTSSNSWFIRKLAPGARPICKTAHKKILQKGITSPADARVLAWPSAMGSTRFWIKNSDVTISAMLGSGGGAVAPASIWDGGPVCAFRLAPQDYHRFHSPVRGVVAKIWEETGTIFSVSADAAQSENAVFLNTRKIVIIETSCCGKVAYIAIGATCVGSVVLYSDAELKKKLKVGDTVDFGSQLGIMQFGGSTVVMLFEKGKVEFDKDILRSTMRSDYVETYMQMGETFGRSLA